MSDGIAELMHWLDPAALSAALSKPRLCDEQLLRRHVSKRLDFYTCAEREAGFEAALSHFAEHRSVQRAIEAGVQAATTLETNE